MRAILVLMKCFDRGLFLRDDVFLRVVYERVGLRNTFVALFVRVKSRSFSRTLERLDIYRDLERESHLAVGASGDKAKGPARSPVFESGLDRLVSFEALCDELESELICHGSKVLESVETYYWRYETLRGAAEPPLASLHKCEAQY